MENIYSEKEFVSKTGMPWGQWEFSLSDEEVNNKLSSLPQSSNVTEDDKHWSNLFSLLQDKSKTPESSSEMDVSVCPTEEDAPMECSSIQEQEENAPNTLVDDITVSLVDICYQVVPKLRNDLNSVQEDMESIRKDLEKLDKRSLSTVMENAWTQLNSEGPRLCFCVPFASNSDLCQSLCSHILLPWLAKNLPSKLEQLSEILSVAGETVCRYLVAPLLRVKDSPVVNDLLSLEELMESMTRIHWTLVLREFLVDLGEIEKWHVPVLATLVEHAVPSVDDMYVLVQLMSSTGSTFAQSREFGALLVAVANCLKSQSGSLVSQLKLISNNYKGPLKFKVLKILTDLKD